MENFRKNVIKLLANPIYFLFFPFMELNILLKNIILGTSPDNSLETYNDFKNNIKVLDLLRFKMLNKCCGGKINQCRDKIQILVTYNNQPEKEKELLKKEIHNNIVSIRNHIIFLNFINIILVIIVLLVLISLIIYFLDHMLSPHLKEKLKEFKETYTI